jgi:hypothetical protein
MRKVELRVMELNKYEVIKKLIDTNGNKKSAMLKLGCSLRNINRLIAKYKSQGKKGFVHGNRDRKPVSATNEDLKCKIIDLYSAKYRDANIKTFLLNLSKNTRIFLFLPLLFIDGCMN